MASWKTAVECKEEKNVEKHTTCCHWRIGEYQLNISTKWDDRQHLSSSWCHWSQTAACLFSLQQHASEIELLPWVYRNKYYCCAWRNKTKKWRDCGKVGQLIWEFCFLNSSSNISYSYHINTNVPKAPRGSARLKPNVYFLLGLLALAQRATIARR